MDSAWLHRARWRRRGAWLWPAFAALTIADAVVGHLLPPLGDGQTVVSAGLVALVLNLIAVVLLSRPLGAALRRARGDLPGIVARDYAGTTVIALVAAALLTAGLVHRSTLQSERNTMYDAVKRAQAYIGDRAPAEFRRNLELADTFVIQQGSIYRTCVPSDHRRRTYCVIVKEKLPFARSVSFSGYEPNEVMSQGTQ
ncbi:MAG TPA: hypothetical protein VFI54_20150 [Solirubrobacteraceae bacterium]|nr:hypothetical protein [Solirubrobacteraceae bacterium]